MLNVFLFKYLGIKSKRARREDDISSFDTIVRNLSSADNTMRLASAIMLRRFLNRNVQKSNLFLYQESANVISSMLKILPTGIFQKTLADGLAYTTDLSNMDLQKTNLQDVYLGRKDNMKINVASTDFYLQICPMRFWKIFLAMLFSIDQFCFVHKSRIPICLVALLEMQT